jgi:hypothetical protein
MSVVEGKRQGEPRQMEGKRTDTQEPELTPRKLSCWTVGRGAPEAWPHSYSWNIT